MQVREGPAHQLARRQRKGQVGRLQLLQQPWRSILFVDLEVANDDGAGAPAHALERVPQRAVRHDVVGYEEEKTDIDHRGAEQPNDLRVSERDRGGMVAVADEVIDQPDVGTADLGEALEGGVLADVVPVVLAGQDDEFAIHRARQRGYVARRQQRRQAGFEEFANVFVAPYGENDLDGGRRGPAQRSDRGFNGRRLVRKILTRQQHVALPQFQGLHPLDIVVAVVGHCVGYLAGIEGGLQVDNRIPDRALGAEAEIAANALRRDMIGL